MCMMLIYILHATIWWYTVSGETSFKRAEVGKFHFKGFKLSNSRKFYFRRVSISERQSRSKFNSPEIDLDLEMRLCKVSASLSSAHFSSSKKKSTEREKLSRLVIFLNMIDCLSSLIDFGIIGICLACECPPPHRILIDDEKLNWRRREALGTSLKLSKWNRFSSLLCVMQNV